MPCKPKIAQHRSFFLVAALLRALFSESLDASALLPTPANRAIASFAGFLTTAELEVTINVQRRVAPLQRAGVALLLKR